VSDETAKRLPRRQLFVYSIAETPMSMASIPVALFLPAFYTQDLGLGMTSVGLILMLARFWDVVTDPVIGYMSDRTQSRFGRRKPWVLVSLPLVMLAVYHLFMPGETVSDGLLGFDPTVTNAPDQVFALQAYFSFVPVAFYALAAYLVVKYPITRSRHHEIREQLAAER